MSASTECVKGNTVCPSFSQTFDTYGRPLTHMNDRFFVVEDQCAHRALHALSAHYQRVFITAQPDTCTRLRSDIEQTHS